MYTQTLNNLLRIKSLSASIEPRRAGLWMGLLIGLIIGLPMSLLGGAAVQAATVNGLYDGTVRIKDRSEATRNTAFAAALAVVLTKISGRSDAPSRVPAAAKNAARYVQRFSYLANGQLEVGFDSTAVNTLLEQAGLPLWDRERPNTLVVYPQALQGLREANMATEQTAKLRGVPIVWANSETSEQLPLNNLPQLQELARRYDAAAVLIARLGPGEVSAANLRWLMVFNGSTQELAGSAEVGPNLAAEVLGRYYSTTSKESMRLFMAVAGVDNLDAYAKTMSYLNGLLMVRAVAVESLQGDVLRVRLEVRGNQESLRRTLALDQRLIEAAAVDAATATPTGDSATTLTYRYRP